MSAYCRDLYYGTCDACGAKEIAVEWVAVVDAATGTRVVGYMRLCGLCQRGKCRLKVPA